MCFGMGNTKYFKSTDNILHFHFLFSFVSTCFTHPVGVDTGYHSVSHFALLASERWSVVGCLCDIACNVEF